jgi:hypothetical protein
MLLVGLFVLNAAAGSPTSQWRGSTDVLSWRGGTIHRVRPSLGGLPFDGPGPVEFRDSTGQLVRRVRSLPTLKPTSLEPTVTRKDARDLVEDGWLSSPEDRGTLVVFPEGHRAHLAWRFQVRATGGVWLVWVDAHQPRVLAAHADSWSTQAKIYDPSPALAGLETVELSGLFHGQKLVGEYAFSTQCTAWDIDPAPYGKRACLDWTFGVKPGPTGDFFEHPREGDTEDPFVQPMVYHHVDRIARWADERYGLRLDEPIQVFTNFPLTNAFFGDFNGDGRRDLSFGISDDGLNFGYDADVVHHEYGHALVRALAGSMWMQADTLGIDWTPGALNEGVADAFAMVLNPDPLIAEHLGESERWDRAIRDLSSDRVCPGDLQGQVHRSGKIWGSMAWNVIDDPALGPELMGDLLVAAVATWDNGTDWSDAAESLLDAAEMMYGADVISSAQLDALEAHVHASGMLDCDRIIDLETAEKMQTILLNLGLDGDYKRIPGGVQFKHRLPAEASGIRLRVDGFTGASQGTGLAIYLRVDAPVEHEATRVEGLGLHHAIPIKFDAVIELDEEEAVWIVDETVLPGLVPGSVLHGSLASINRTRMPMDVVFLSVALAAEPLLDVDSIFDKGPSTGCSALNQLSLFEHCGWLIFCAFGLIVMRRR